MPSSDGITRDLVSPLPGVGWNFGITRHPYYAHELPLGPHYTVYNRRLMVCCFDQQTVEDGYWLLRQKAALLHTAEWPIEFTGPDATRLLDKLFTQDIARVKVNQCTYGLACYPDGGLIVDGILLKLNRERYWFAQADGDFFNWARAHSAGMDVDISDPKVYVSQVQGPNALRVLSESCDNGLPADFPYFGIARVKIAGQELIVSRTGYTNEIGWEFYTEPHHDADRLLRRIMQAGESYGLAMHGLDSMNIRRIEAGILNAGSDFNAKTTPYDVGLGRFVDEKKCANIGAQALASAPRESRLIGLKCAEGIPKIGGAILINNDMAGAISAGAQSPYLRAGIGIGLLIKASSKTARCAEIECIDGTVQKAQLVDMPFYDKKSNIPRGRVEMEE